MPLSTHWTVRKPGPEARVALPTPCAAVLGEGGRVGLAGHCGTAEGTGVKWLCQSEPQTQSRAQVPVTTISSPERWGGLTPCGPCGLASPCREQPAVCPLRSRPASQLPCSLLTPSHFQGPGEPGTRKPLLGQFLDHRMTQRPSQGLRVCPRSSLAEEASWSCGWPERSSGCRFSWCHLLGDPAALPLTPSR